MSHLVGPGNDWPGGYHCLPLRHQITPHSSQESRKLKYSSVTSSLHMRKMSAYSTFRVLVRPGHTVESGPVVYVDVDTSKNPWLSTLYQTTNMRGELKWDWRPTLQSRLSLYTWILTMVIFFVWNYLLSRLHDVSRHSILHLRQGEGEGRSGTCCCPVDVYPHYYSSC